MEVHDDTYPFRQLVCEADFKSHSAGFDGTHNERSGSWAAIIHRSTPIGFQLAGEPQPNPENSRSALSVLPPLIYCKPII